MKSSTRFSLLLSGAVALGGAVLQTRAADRSDRDERSESKAERKGEKARQASERKEYERFPKDARKALKREVKDADNVDYFTEEHDEKRAFGARYRSDGRTMDLVVNEDGEVLRSGEVDAGTVAAADAPAAANVEPTHIRGDEIPDAARTTFAGETRDAKDIEYYRIHEPGSDGRAFYHATYTTDRGANMRLDVAEDGTVLSKRNERDEPVETASGAIAVNDARDPNDFSVKLDELPGPTREAIEHETAGARKVSLYKAMFGTRPCYEAKYITEDGRDIALRVDDAGKILEKRELSATRDQKDPNDYGVEFAEMPKAVQETARRETRDGKDVHYYRAMYGKQHVFEAKFRDRDGHPIALRIANDGKVVERRDLSEDAAKPAKQG